MINLRKKKEKDRIRIERKLEKKKILSTTEGNITHDLPYIGRMLYLFTKGSYNTAYKKF